MYNINKTENFKNYFFLLICILSQSISVVFSKLAAISNQSLLFLVFDKFYILSILFLAIQAFFWQKVLRVNAISSVYPSMTLVNLFLLFWSYYIFGNHIYMNEIVGIIIILIGIIIINIPIREK